MKPIYSRLLLGIALLACGQSSVWAVPLMFDQRPLNGGLAPSSGGAPFVGHGESSTATLTTPPSYIGTYAADDFALSASTSIVHVEWYGSYAVNQKLGGASQFLIAFESDAPASIFGPSHPGAPLLSQIVSLGALAPGSGTFSETAIASAGLTQLYHYQAELTLPFDATADTLYWLKIVALNHQQQDGGTYLWNWQVRDYQIENTLAPVAPDVSPGESQLAGSVWHFQDAAVTGAVEVTPIAGGPTADVEQALAFARSYVSIASLDGSAGIQTFKSDLAFGLASVSVPEPLSAVMLGFGIAAIVLIARRRTRQCLTRCTTG